MLSLPTFVVSTISPNIDWLGIQIAQVAIIATQFSMATLSVVLIIGIQSVSSIIDSCHVSVSCQWKYLLPSTLAYLKENESLVVPFPIGFLTFMSLETVAMVISFWHHHLAASNDSNFSFGFSTDTRFTRTFYEITSLRLSAFYLF